MVYNCLPGTNQEPILTCPTQLQEDTLEPDLYQCSDRTSRKRHKQEG